MPLVTVRQAGCKTLGVSRTKGLVEAKQTDMGAEIMPALREPC